MPPGPSRFATCTPVAFHANPTFYTRDTGLICRELRKQGHSCRVIMPLPSWEDDLETDELLRVPMSRLRQPAWWKSQGLDAVILYSWGDPRYTRIARAIRKAGLKLIIHFDSSGELHEHLHRPGNRALNAIKDCAVNLLRRLHLGYAHSITTSGPCIESFRNDVYYGAAIANKCHEFPTPVNSCFKYDGTAKQVRIICTGSWQYPVKRTPLMMQVLELTLQRNGTAQADICGTLTPELQAWHNALTAEMQQRIHLHGQCSHARLSQLCMAASISLCTSESEGSHGASAEALCCGCSVVCPPRPLLSVVQWYTSRNSGTVATEDTAEALCTALLAELQLWEDGTRQASAIAATWQPCFQPGTLPGLH